MKKLFYILLLFFATLQPLSAYHMVGNLKGALTLTQGKASYTIDILTPPGIAGVAPKLTFEYNQDGSNTALGKGWSIGGISSISRCGSTLAQDDTNKGVRFNYEDHYCLDGQRLIAIEGEDGKDGTVYKTEIDNYSKIISYGSAGNGPEYFIVYTKSGDIYKYGTTSNSRVKLSNGTVYTWKVSRISDRLDNDNTIRFQYNNEHHIQNIYYARDNNQIEFHYTDNRQDIVSGYVGGDAYKYTQRLETVEVSTYGSRIRDYNLKYYSSSNTYEPLKLKSIQECDGECLNPIVFD